MKILLVPWMLLLLGVNLNSGHYIRVSEYGNPNIYQIKKTSSGISFENPMQENPSLREMLYYYIIERPQEEPTITERSFTNGHGYQFIAQEPISKEEYDEKAHELKYDEDERRADENQEYIPEGEDTGTYEEERETTPLTDKDVKEAYKTRSYLFDQARQRYAVKRMARPDSLKRRRRQAEMEIPDAPRLSNNDAYDVPRTYGMNLNPEGGYVWNNINKPGSFYELEPSNEKRDEGQYESAQSPENTPLANENAYTPSEISDPASSEDIFVNTYRPSAMPLETATENANLEVVNDDPAPTNKNPSDGDAESPVAPILGNDEVESKEGFDNIPIGPEVYETPETSNPVAPIVENPEPNESTNTQELEVPQANTPIVETVEGSNENPGYGYEKPELEEPKSESSPEDISGSDKIKEIPEAPTLSPLNYDNLPGYIRDAISSTEKPTSYEQTDNPYINPQPNPDDKKVMEDKMEDIFATVQPIEDIPKTYGMNLTSGGGHVWNDMVDPPVSYDVGTPSKTEEKDKEEQTQAPTIEQPEIHEEPENPIPEPAEPPKEPAVHPEEPNQEPDTNESEEAKNPIEQPEIHEQPENPIPEPAEPPKEEPPVNTEEPNPPQNPEIEGELEEPIPDPDQVPPVPGNQPQTPENEEPAHPVEPLEPEPTVEPVIPEVIPEGNEDNQGTEGTEQPVDGEKPTEENVDHVGEPGVEPVEEIPKEENNKPDIMSELLKSEQFWKWLGEWTATYMELLEKHMRKIAVQEICKREKSGEQMCPLDDSEDAGVIVKDGKIIVDGREIDITHTDNLDSELKGHSNNKHENKGSNGNKIEANQIYGNSVGNEKVTNVFIFTADKAEEVIDNLKPSNGTDIVIDDRIKEDGKDESNKEKSIEDISTTEESNIDNVNQESNEGTVNTEEANTEEINKEANEAAATTVATKEPNENEATTNKNSDSKPASNEDLIKDENLTEEANTEEYNKEANQAAATTVATKEPNENESTTNENTDSKPASNEEDLNKDEDPKGTRSDIGESGDEADEESKLDSSEKNKNSNEYLEKQ